MKPIYIFDLDGTIALNHHRQYLVRGEKPDWDEFFRQCMYDTPNYPVIRTLQDLRRMGAEIWIWSGRSDIVIGETLDWLMEHRVIDNRSFRFWIDPTDRFRMRAQGDHTPDEKLKKSWLDGLHVKDRRRLIAVFDDRKKVVDMWRAAGVACFQVQDGNF